MEMAAVKRPGCCTPAMSKMMLPGYVHSDLETGNVTRAVVKNENQSLLNVKIPCQVLFFSSCVFKNPFLYGGTKQLPANISFHNKCFGCYSIVLQFIYHFFMTTDVQLITGMLATLR